MQRNNPLLSYTYSKLEIMKELGKELLSTFAIFKICDDREYVRFRKVNCRVARNKTY